MQLYRFPSLSSTFGAVLGWLAIGLFAPQLRAEVFLFEGGEGSNVFDFQTAAYWSGGEIPPPDSELEIRFKGMLRNSPRWSAASLVVGQHSALWLTNSEFDVSGDVELRGGEVTLQSRGVLRVEGALELSDGGRLISMGDASELEAGEVHVGTGCAMSYWYFKEAELQNAMEKSAVTIAGTLRFEAGTRITIVIQPVFGGWMPAGEYLLATAGTIEGSLPELECMEPGEGGNADLRPVAIDGLKLENRDGQLILVME